MEIGEFQVKRRKVSVNCWQFSHEVLLLIFQHLSNGDLINLSCVSHEFRHLLLPYMFNSLKLNWKMILNKFNGQPLVISQDDTLNKFHNCVEIIEVIEPNLQNEWNFKFNELFKTFQNLHQLKLNIKSSSNFLKYNQLIPSLKNLHIVTSQQDSDFNLNHLKQFPNIENLTINGFLIDFDPLEDLEGLDFIRIKNLSIINCSWNYPFKLSYFKNSMEIEHLSLIYSNSFIISERFREFLNDPNLPNLKYLTIQNNNHNLKLHITYKIFNFLQNIPNLQKLYLVGNIYNETLMHFTKMDFENRLRYCLNVNNVKIFYSSFIQ